MLYICHIDFKYHIISIINGSRIKTNQQLFIYSFFLRLSKLFTYLIHFIHFLPCYLNRSFMHLFRKSIYEARG